MNNRLVELRKLLELNQREFSEKIGISQPSLALIEKGKANLTERNFNEICRVFNVNPEWLRSGTGEMFKEKSFVEELAERYSLGYREKALIQSLLELPDDTRDAAVDWMLSFAEKVIEEEMRKDNEEVEKRRKLVKQRAEIDAQIAEIDARQASRSESQKSTLRLEETG